MPSPAARFFPLAAALVLLLGGAGLPGVGPADPRVPVDDGQAPWRGIGRVQTELGGRCTGFLIGPRLAVTAAHCLFLPRVGRFIQPHSVHFVVGYAAGVFAGHARAVSFSIGPGYDPRREGGTLGADWAVLRLDTALGTPDRVLAVSRAPAAIGGALALGGYGRDREERMAADLACHVTGWNGDGGRRDVMHHDCAATIGTSGAPLLARGPDGAWMVVGVQVAATLGRAGGLAVPASAIVTGREARSF